MVGTMAVALLRAAGSGLAHSAAFGELHVQRLQSVRRQFMDRLSQCSGLTPPDRGWRAPSIDQAWRTPSGSGVPVCFPGWACPPIHHAGPRIRPAVDDPGDPEPDVDTDHSPRHLRTDRFHNDSPDCLSGIRGLRQRSEKRWAQSCCRRARTRPTCCVRGLVARRAAGQPRGYAGSRFDTRSGAWFAHVPFRLGQSLLRDSDYPHDPIPTGNVSDLGTSGRRRCVFRDDHSPGLAGRHYHSRSAASLTALAIPRGVARAPLHPSGHPLGVETCPQAGDCDPSGRRRRHHGRATAASTTDQSRVFSRSPTGCVRGSTTLLGSTQDDARTNADHGRRCLAHRGEDPGWQCPPYLAGHPQLRVIFRLHQLHRVYDHSGSSRYRFNRSGTSTPLWRDVHTGGGARHRAAAS